MINLDFTNEFDGMSEEEIKNKLYEVYLSNLEHKKNNNGLKEAKEYFRVNCKEIAVSAKRAIWETIKRKVCTEFGVKTIPDLSIEDLGRANEFAIKLIDDLKK